MKVKFKDLKLSVKQKMYLDVIFCEIVSELIIDRYYSRLKGTKFGDPTINNASSNILKLAQTMKRAINVNIGYDSRDFREEMEFERVPFMGSILFKLMCMPPSALEQLDNELNDVVFEDLVKEEV